MKHTLRLTPFHHAFQTKVMVQFERTDNLLTVEFMLSHVRDINWETLTRSKRTDFLWENTCLEVFLHPMLESTHSPYVEINVAPCGDWNLYAFHDYRQPDTLPPQQAQLSDALQTLNVTTKDTATSDNAGRCLTIDLDLLQNALTSMQPHIYEFKSDITWLMNMTAVVRAKDTIDYYAYTHAQPADFHDKSQWYLLEQP